jgi:hypothetical protein
MGNGLDAALECGAFLFVAGVTGGLADADEVPGQRCFVQGLTRHTLLYRLEKYRLTAR